MHVLVCEVHVHVGVSMWEHVCMHVHACAYYERVSVCMCLEGNRLSYFEIANVGMDHFYPVEAKVECL